MKVTKIENNEYMRPPPYGLVTEKRTGDIMEVRYQAKKMPQRILKLDKNNFIELATGELKEFKHSDLRISHIENVSRSLRNLRDLINANVTAENSQNCQWVTLTYRENMRDTKKLYVDFYNFNKRYQRYLRKNNLPKAEYIACVEPQQRGAYHFHVIFIFPEKAPFIKNEILAKIWGQGFVKIKSLNDVDNIGIYLCAYLGDLEAPEEIDLEKIKENGKLKIVTVGENGKKRKKAIIKGARLYFYPSGFQIYRHSRGIKKPEIIETTEAEAMEDVKGAALTYEKTIQLSEQGQVLNQINYRQYNRARKREIQGENTTDSRH